MKAFRPLATLALVAGFASAVPAFAAAEHGGHHVAAAAAPADAQATFNDGTVKKVDKAAGKITISHGPLADLQMPAMTMVFRAAEPAMLDQVKAGDKIRFVAAKVEGVFTVTKIEDAK
jgi:Cu(I)/Ag(I) efflux system protein CusF